ncbi:SAM-dependent methyltransferase [Kitasatospora sp. NPDC088548]|uniref:SAM-dependent methyltransferase n=1 Tax=Kitasatospora sp. NPDC088548 TaxID=3364075 RepID=UPI00380806F2
MSLATAWVDDPFAEAVRTGRGPLWLRLGDGGRISLDIERWCAPAGGADHGLLLRCLHTSAPVLDLGCGPGRLVAALSALGVPALGVDVTGAAVDRTVGIGGAALCRSVFDRLPAEGRWGAALLADGNLGIGGDPDTLLRRCAEHRPGRPVAGRGRGRGDRRALHRAGRGPRWTPRPGIRLGPPRRGRHRAARPGGGARRNRVLDVPRPSLPRPAEGGPTG